MSKTIHTQQLEQEMRNVLNQVEASRDSLNIEDYLNQILSNLREESPRKQGYAVVNILNLLCHCQTDLSGYDFSNLSICQAYLPNVQLHRVNFTNCNLAKSVFAETLGNVYALAISRDGKLATADDGSIIRIWTVPDFEQVLICKGHTDYI